MTIKELEKDLNSRGGNLSGIYKITRKSDGKVYIGQSECITKRIIQHINNIRETNSDKIDGAIQSEGWENFTYDIELALPELNTEQLWLAESTYINKYNSYITGFNRTKGNHIGKYDHAEFTRKNVVSVALTKELRDHFKLDFNNKKVLLVNLFDDQFVNALQYLDCEVIQISKYFESKDDLGKYITESLRYYINIKFDLVIANSPYGKIGANITKLIIDTIDYDEFINILPANDYKRNTSKDLYNYVDLDSMIPILNGFTDAVVTTHMARIYDHKVNNLTLDEFERSQYIDRQLDKYFEVNSKRTTYLENNYNAHGNCTYSKATPQDTICFGEREFSHRHLPYSKTVNSYKWNVEESISSLTVDCTGKCRYILIKFNTPQEKQNCVSFLYSDTGFKFISKLLTALNKDGYDVGYFLPKVDWTRTWTVEEILRDYSYTQKEIDDVFEDLMRFKAM